MNISVFKDNQSVVEVNLGAEILGNLQSDATFFVGRSPECHVHLDDKQISREHAEISYEDGKWNIKRLSPFSKVVINGTQYEAKQLIAGDIITVGPYVLNIAIPEVESITSSEIREEKIEVVTESFDDETIAMSPEELNEDENANIEYETSNDNFESDINEMESTDSNEEESEFFENNEDEIENDGFGEDENYAVDAFEDDEADESTRVIQTFAKIEFEIFGEHAPYEKYVLDAPEVIIGRDPEKCQIVLNDPEVSGTHALLKKSNITCLIEDLDSGNGTLLNGERINKSVLTNGDEIIIGETTFTVRISSDFLQEEEQRLMPVEENQVVEVEEIVEVDADFDDEALEAVEGETEGKQSLIADIKNYRNLPPERKRKVTIILAVLALALLFLLDDGSKPEKKTAKKKERESFLLNKATQPENKKKKLLKKLTKEQQEFVESNYLLAKEQMKVGKYRDAIGELDRIHSLIPEYKQSKQLYELAKSGLAKLEAEEKKRREEIARKEREAKVKILVEKAKEAVKEKQVVRAKSLFSEIMSLDPENFDVPILKGEIEDFERRQQEEAMRKAEAEAERKRQIDMLAPGKNFYLNKKWHSAILKLQDFIRKKDIDEDLMSEASNMLSKSKESLNNIVQPLLGKARSLKEGQDLKGAYETYLEILKTDPSSAEALDESNEIREKLKNRSKKIYREAIIAESLSLFDDAKEKFQEVQQVSPSDSEYYKKATEKLKDYLD